MNKEDWIDRGRWGRRHDEWFRQEHQVGKVFYPLHRENVPPGSSRILGAEDGFPWSDIPESVFTSRGINFKEIDQQEIKWILAKGSTSFYEELETGGIALARFRPYYQMGMYIENNPVGFTYGGMIHSDWTSVKIAEAGLIHLVPSMRKKGLGTVVFDMTFLYLLSNDPDEIFVDIADTTGAVQHIVNKLGFIHKGTFKQSYPRYNKTFDSDQERSDFQRLLTEQITLKLQ